MPSTNEFGQLVEPFHPEFHQIRNINVRKYRTTFSFAKVFKADEGGPEISMSKQKESDPEEGTFYNEDFEKEFKNFMPPRKVENCLYKLTLIVGDEQGNIKWLDLTAFIRKVEDEKLFDNREASLFSVAKPSDGKCTFVKPVPPYHKTKLGFMPDRKLRTEAGINAKTMLDIYKGQPKPRILDAMRCI